MSEDNSVTRWIEDLKAGESEAGQRIWERYFQRLLRVARRRFGTTPRRVADEEDVAISVFDSVFDGVKQGNFPELASREELWRLLVAITQQKVVDQQRRAGALKRGGGAVRGDSALETKSPDSSPSPGFAGIADESPGPESIAQMQEQYEKLLSLLRDDKLRTVAILQMEGHSKEEIAARIGTVTRTVDRKLKVIREKWRRELDSDQ